MNDAVVWPTVKLWMSALGQQRKAGIARIFFRCVPKDPMGVWLATVAL